MGLGRAGGCYIKVLNETGQRSFVEPLSQVLGRRAGGGRQ